MYAPFYIEFTADDRIKFEPKVKNNQLQGLRIKYQTARKTDKVNYSVKGFEPFFEYEWLTVVKYENLKGMATKDLMRPTPVTFSPHGLHVKESWGNLNNKDFIKKFLDDMKYWEENRTKYGENLLPVTSERREIANKNLVRTSKFVTFIFDENNVQSKMANNLIYPNQTLVPIPEPEEDDWLLEQNSIAFNRIDKRAHKGDPDIISIGPFKVLTYQRSGE
ncbi:MAG: hypothetical protein KatS3mg068_0849 [Candidatus Sericytochromatia bacterium]|nr:MAG: hypothetical protein KatS3mg068_0849 [Candidatus Sericytochromatia bacterium]